MCHPRSMLRLEDDTELGSRFRAAGCVFFDCDGVVFDSNGFKVEAMRRALAAYPSWSQQPMLEYWRSNGGVSRWVKFRYFFEHIFVVDDVAGAVEEACESFGRYSLEAYAAHAPVAEAIVAARAVGEERAVVVSGASQRELRTVFEAKGIAGLFAAILGSPPTKQELCEAVLHDRGLAGADALFIGDGGGDFRVAQELKIPFVYLHQFSEWDDALETLAAADGVTWAEDWASLLDGLGLSPSSR